MFAAKLRSSQSLGILKLVLTLAMLALLLTAAAPAQTTIHVPADVPTIQAGIDAAANGDTVLVAPGTYNENINFSGKAITVTSSGGASVTIIDGGLKASVVTFSTGESAQAGLNGFTIQNGEALYPNGYTGGGVSIRSASPTITNNVIQNNFAASYGGGIGVNNGAPKIQGNTIQNNSEIPGYSGGGGAGIYLGGGAGTQIIANLIANNYWGSGDGGGILGNANSAVTIMNNVITGNTATGISPASRGGGIDLINQSDVLISQNVIYNNNAGQGSGVAFLVPSGTRGPIMVNNTIVGGGGGSQGTALYAAGYDAQVQAANNLLIGAPSQNAVQCDGTYGSQSPVFTNNDVFAASGTGLAGTCSAQSGSNGNLSADPLFVNSAAADFHLQTGSSAIDAGTNSAPSLPQTDLAGNPRMLDGNNDCVSAADLGAYEFVATANAAFSSGSLSFSSQVIGTSSGAQAVTLSNSGSTCFQFSGVQVSGDFSQTNNCPTAGLRGGSSCTYNVTFTPTARDSRTGALTVTGSDGMTKSAPSVALSGTGLAPAAASLSPASLTFGPQWINSTSAAQTVTLTNTGDALLILGTIATNAPFAESSACPDGLPGGASCSINVNYTSTVAGTQSGSLTVNDNASGSPQSVALSGTAVDFVVSVTPSSVSVKRGAQAQLAVGVAAVGGSLNASVALSCSGLPAGASCSFSPSAVGLGGGSALMLGTTAKTPRGTFSVSVVGTAGSLQHSVPVTLTVK